jgi:choline dehydrogenase-like flavoprotein
MLKHYDVLIIGTGAGGGTLAYALASTGKQILLLDRGDFIPREKANWQPQAAYMEGRYRTDERWLNNQGETFQPGQYYQVGGNTKVYGAALLRMRSQDFAQMYHYEGLSPAWPLQYEDLEPYYNQAEILYQVHGQRGKDPTEPPATQDYPFPSLPHSRQIQTVADRLSQAGLHPFELPMGLDYDTSRSSPCILCDTCDGYACLLGAKADAQTSCVEKAIQFQNVTLKTGVRVDRLITSPSGREVKSVEATINGEREIFSADIVVVSCSAINSAALLLRSANDRHPQGLANSSGQVGRNLMKHNATKLYAINPREPNSTQFQKTLAINDFYLSSPADHFPLGHIHLMGKHKWEMMYPDFPKIIPQLLLNWMANHSVDWWLQSEDLPDPRNQVTINAQGQVQVSYTPNNLKAHQQLKQQFKAVLRQIGFPILLETPIPLKTVNHQVGTCRFGDDPTSSVLDLNCRTHDIDNLYVVDSSFFPSSSAINPALTIAANALRVADHLQQRLGANPIKALERSYLEPA